MAQEKQEQPQISIDEFVLDLIDRVQSLRKVCKQQQAYIIEQETKIKALSGTDEPTVV